MHIDMGTIGAEHALPAAPPPPHRLTIYYTYNIQLIDKIITAYIQL